MLDTPTLTGLYTYYPPTTLEEAIPRDPVLAEKAWKWIEMELADSGNGFQNNR